MTSEYYQAPTPAYGLPFGWIGRTAMFAESQGINIRAQLLAAGVAAGSSEINDETLIYPADFLLMSALLINAFDDELHGITPVRMSRGTASMVAKAMACDRTLGCAIDTAMRFFDMIASSCRLRMDQSEGFADVVIHAEGQDGTLTSLIEELVAQFLHHQFSFFLGFPLPLLAFRTSASSHPSHGGDHPYLLCPVLHGCHTALVFRSDLLNCGSQASIKHGPLIDAQLFWLAHHPRQRHQSRDWNDHSTLSESIFSYLSIRDQDLAACCLALNLGCREVQRRLMREGTSFRRLRRSALVRRARPALLKGASTEDVAETLGYSDARSFRRALKVATGLSISQIREDGGQESHRDDGFLEELKSQALLMI